MKRTVQFLVGLALLSACGGQQPPTAASADVRSRAAATPQSNQAIPANSGLGQELAIIRRVTAPFHDFDVARAAGWSTQITSCLIDPGGAGGMGFHWGNTTLINGTAQIDEPQLLLYEPDESGRLRLMAVEYIIPYSFHSSTAPPPVLLGQPFLRFDGFQVWGLHVWIWKDNPSGLFAPWNPLVTCAGTADVARMAH